MVHGFNSDVDYNGSNFHIQTEDWGVTNPFIVSRVYKNGAVMRSFKTAYSEISINPLLADDRAIVSAVKYQHQKILDLLLSGQLL